MIPAPYHFVFDWMFPAVFCWSLIVLASLAGWGKAVARWLAVEGEPDCGLAITWGIGLFLSTSGFLIALALFSKTFVLIFILGGLGCLVWRLWATRSIKCDGLPQNTILRVILAVLVLLIAINFTDRVAGRGYNSCDDFAAYFAHAKMLLDTGTVSDPFNFRLMASLDGQQTLATFIVGFFSWKYSDLLDTGLAQLIVLGLAAGLVREAGDKGWIARMVLVFLALTFQIPHANTASEMTGVMLFLALLRTFDVVAARRCTGWRSALLLGAMITAAATLRCHNVFAVALLGIGFGVWRFWEATVDRRTLLREGLATLGATFFLLLPGCITAFRSSGVIFYPLIKGTQRPEFALYKAPMSPLGEAIFIGGFFLFNGYLIHFLLPLLLKKGSQKRAALIYSGAILLISIAFVSQITNALYSDLYRYLIPMGFAVGLYTAGLLAQQIVEKTGTHEIPFPAWRMKIILVILAFVLLVDIRRFAYKATEFWPNIHRGMDANYEMWTDPVGPVYTTAARHDYPEAFATIPAGSLSLIAVDYPFLLDYRAHRLYSIDVPGAASPAPGFPYFQGPAPVKAYLLAHGIHYVAHVPFDNSDFLHSRRHNLRMLMSSVAIYRMLAKYELDFFENIEALDRSNPVLYDSPTVRVIDLKESAEPAPTR